jgi:hypothetical protein
MTKYYKITLLDTPVKIIRKTAQHGDVLDPYTGSGAAQLLVFDKHPTTLGLDPNIQRYSWVRAGDRRNDWSDLTVNKIGTFELVDSLEEVTVATTAKKPEPIVASCVDPLDKLLSTVIGGRTGAACLQVYEDTMRRDLGGRHQRKSGDPRGVAHYVAGNLTIDQTALAMQCWSEKLRKSLRAARDTEKYRVTLQTDDDDVLIPVK